MDRFKKHLSNQKDRWLADKAELEEALIDIDAGRIANVPEGRRAALRRAIQNISDAIEDLDVFIEDRTKMRIVR